MAAWPNLPPGTLQTRGKGVIWDTIVPKLCDLTVKTVRDTLGFTEMTPVQAATIPNLTQFKDVAVEAPTGSGKTIAFVVPAIEILKKTSNFNSNDVIVLIVTPTRELSYQILNVLNQFSDGFPVDSPLRVLQLIGGSHQNDNVEAVRSSGCNVIVGTPGKIEECLRTMPEIKLKKLELLILDEADVLLDLGFYSTIASILKRIPKQRRTGIFSATLTRKVNDLIRAGLRNPIKISIKVEDTNGILDQITPSTLKNYFVKVECDAKFSLLIYFLNGIMKEKKTIIYFCSIASVVYFKNVFDRLELVSEMAVFALHGNLPQKKRLEIYASFLQIDRGIMLCTDLAARGLDFQNVTWVVHFDPPRDSNFFVHRIGRTARIGKEGNALLFVLPGTEAYFDLLELKKVPIEVLPGFDSITVSVIANETTQQKDLNGLEDLCPKLKNLSLADRSMMEKSTLAFISFIKAYKENTNNFVFKVKDLNFAKVARLFGIVKLPRMSEITGPVKDFVDEDIDLDTIPYLNEQQEKSRIKKLEKKTIKNITVNPQRKRQRENKKNIFQDLDEQQSDSDDEEAMAIEARYLKKLNNGKITKKQYDTMFSVEAIEEEAKRASGLDRFDRRVCGK